MMYKHSVCSFSLGKLPQRSSLWALSLSLSAVNLSESAQGKMAPAQLTQMYVTAATALRTVLGHHLSFLPVSLLQCPIIDPVYLTEEVADFMISVLLWMSLLSIICIFSPVSVLQGYLLSCAESVANQSETKPIPDCLRWLFTPLGRQFFLSCDWSVKSESTDGVYTSQRDPGMSEMNELAHDLFRSLYFYFYVIFVLI